MDAGIVMLLASAAVMEVVGSAAVVNDDGAAMVDNVESRDVVAVGLEVSRG